MLGTAAGADRTALVQTALLAWYATNRRDLPWRHTRDPYAILVAEVMLQQTQVDRVIPKWHAWLERFPKLADLAKASRADAIRAWQGLGYNLRAVRLHAIACQVMADYGGELPRSVPGLLALKGIGPYTAGAVACFAYEQPVAMVDTNVRRVLSRVFCLEPAEVEAHADKVVPPHAAYAWNQALMDLGATFCRTSRPMCLLCPLVRLCGGPVTEGRPAPASKSARSERSATQFHGSRRYVRGRLVDVLRSAPAGVPLETLVTAVGSSSERGRILELLNSLAADGLVTVEPAATTAAPGAASHVRLRE